MARMVWIVCAILTVIWVLGLVTHVGGNFIHAALLLAIALVVFNLVNDSKPRRS